MVCFFCFKVFEKKKLQLKAGLLLGLFQIPSEDVALTEKVLVQIG